MYVCLCSGVTDQQIRDAIAAGDTDLKALRKKLGVAISCGMCVPDAREILNTESEQLAMDLAIDITNTGQQCAA
ncbi:(2Fe-2S)-binding protein [Oceanospirillum sediminis]|uniref:Bacterioferritin-associated ferredoxin n=1 Tax=Oceanospirillum sediminis TaxID=2760088 RepID=A0A839INY3_9GAMM|nr:(2Fe-2S)-binding protein [Oceanospirillum sediminis]MBB1486222.1 (2Fe-2S)-binding protein [Oceanospirillum sediminis]